MNLYPEINPFDTFMLQADDLHKIHVEQSGNPNGIPVVFLHGGPGAGSSPLYRRYFNPAKYRIIVFDQRGCGKSTPYGVCENNTTHDLISDIKLILSKLNIEKINIYGGSWGSTLALLFAETYPQLVHSLVLRGIFLCRKKDIQWFYQKGANSIYPDYWKEFISGLDTNEQENILHSFYHKIHSSDIDSSREYCRQWSLWEGRSSTLKPSSAVVDAFDDCSISLAKIETHFFYHDCFIKENQIIKNIDSIKNIPCHIVHGRYDIVRPFNQAYDLHAAYGTSIIHEIRDAGHSLLEEGITKKILEIYDNDEEFIT